MELFLPILAIAIALSAAGLSYLTFWHDWRKPFALICTIRGELWQPPAGERPDTPFSIILPLVLRNAGARAGIVQAAFISLLTSDPPQEFRLEAIATVNTTITIQTASAEDESEKAKALLGFGSFIQLGKYEAKELGIHFAFPPIDAKRYHLFTAPALIKEGDYRLEIWFCIEDVWDCYAKDPVVTVRKGILDSIAKGIPVVNISGAVYDRAPGAPLDPKQS